MKISLMVFFALLLLLLLILATPEAYGQGLSRADSKLLSDDRLKTGVGLGRKADVGVTAREAKDLTATASLLAATEQQEDDENNPTYGRYGRDTDPTGQVHHVFISGNNPYAPKPKKSP